VSEVTKHQIRRFLVGDVSAGLFTQAWTYLLPVIVIAVLGAKENAIFYSAFAFASALDQIASNFGAVLVVEGARDERRLAELTKSVMRKTCLLLTPAVLVFVTLAPVILGVYGAAYSRGGAALRLLALACLPKAVLFVYYGVCRLRGQTHRAAAVQGFCAVAILGGASMVSSDGLAAVGWVVLGVQTLAATLVAPQMARAIRHRGDEQRLAIAEGAG
jgi:O-antigen/teichoic acid export membrane protein